MTNLQDDGVSCGDGVDGGTETAPDRVIPRSEDKHNTQRLLPHSSLVKLECDGNRDIFLLCPFINLT